MTDTIYDALTERERQIAVASRLFNEAGQESCSEIEALLSPYATNRAAESNAKARKDASGIRIKKHLESCDEADHRDGEHGLSAELQRKEALEFDVLSMPEEMIVALAGMGALKVDVAVLRALKGKSAPVDDAWRFAMRGESVSLIVKADKR